MISWDDLPVDMLVVIAECIVYLEDYVSFVSTCKSWQLVALILGTRPSLPPRSPWVMLPDASMKGKELDTEHPVRRMLEPPEETRDSQGRQMRCFYSLSTSKTYEFELPEATHRKCIGASYGWVLTVGYDLQINLLHPFSRRQIKLPHLLTFKDQWAYNDIITPKHVVDVYVTKVVLSKNPNDDDFVAMAIYGTKSILALARAGDEVWSDVVGDSRGFKDVIYYNNMFYAVTFKGLLYTCDIRDESGPKSLLVGSPIPDGTADWNHKYLVESLGELLLLARFRDDDLVEMESGRTIGFLVFRLDKEQDTNSEYPYKWTLIKNLGGRALFLGNNVSVSMNSSECVNGDCIYFSEHDGEKYYSCEVDGGGRDTGIFDVTKDTVESHYVSKFHCPLSPPLWYI